MTQTFGAYADPKSILPERIKRLKREENEEFAEIAEKLGVSTEQLTCAARRLLIAGTTMNHLQTFLTEA